MNAPTKKPVDFNNFNERATELMNYLCAKNRKLTLEAAATAAALIATDSLIPSNGDGALVSPNELLRCGLFGVASAKVKREYRQGYRYILQASRGGFINYTGMDLRQDDCDVFMSLLHAEQATPGVALINLRKFAKEVGFGTSNEALTRLENSLIRMKASAVEINVNKSVGPKGQVMMTKTGFSLIEKYEEVKKGVWVIYLPQEIRGLCSKNRYTRVLKSHLEQLTRGAALASWLLKFYSTHREPFAMKLTELHALSGSGAELKEFKRMTKDSLEQLKKIGFLESFKVGATDVTVVRNLAVDEAPAV